MQQLNTKRLRRCQNGDIVGTSRARSERKKVKVAQLCLNLCNPRDCSPPVPLSMEFCRQEYWRGLPFPSSGDPPHRGVKPGSPRLQADSLPYMPAGKPLRVRRFPNPSPCRLPRWTFKDRDLIVFVPSEDQEPHWGYARFFVIFSFALTSLVTAHPPLVLKPTPHAALFFFRLRYTPQPDASWFFRLLL